MREVAIIGVGMTKFGELWNKSLRDLFVEAALVAVDDAAIDINEIDSMYVGSMSSGLFTDQEHIGPLLADNLGIVPAPATRVESACGSGGIAFRQGFIEVASGFSDIVLVGGVEKMTDVSGKEATYALATATDQEYESYHGLTFPALNAMLARRHMHQYGTTREQLAQVAVKNHKNGTENPFAQLRFEITIEQVMNSIMIADPLRLLDCSPLSDGAAVAILCPVKMAREFNNKPIKIIGSGQATDTMALHNRKDITILRATVEAGKRAYEMAGIGPEDIDVSEVHDSFTILETCIIEDLGFVEKGEGGKATEEGRTAIGGDIPVNTSGGLKAKGHPVGATGISQIAEIVKQLKGQAGQRQIVGAKVGLTHNMGGLGGSAVVHILEAI